VLLLNTVKIYVVNVSNALEVSGYPKQECFISVYM